jgi:hypothetical protein
MASAPRRPGPTAPAATKCGGQSFCARAPKLMDGRVYVAGDRLAQGTPLRDNQSLPEWWTRWLVAPALQCVVVDERLLSGMQRPPVLAEAVSRRAAR